MYKPDIRLNAILRKAIENDPDFLAVYFEEGAIDYMVEMAEEKSNIQEQIDMILRANPSVIYSKKFARAFWYAIKEKYVWVCFSRFDRDDDEHRVMPWQYHQLKLILADDPLAYLESFL